jgi:hypothetical protein
VEYMEDDTPSGPIWGSLARSLGFALGELLLLTDRSEELQYCLSAIEATAKATVLSSRLARGERIPRRVAPSLIDAALSVVRAWHEDTEDLVSLSDAIALLQDSLLFMGVEPPDPD